MAMNTMIKVITLKIIQLLFLEDDGLISTSVALVSLIIDKSFAIALFNTCVYMLD
jgi:hypothetical protein